MKSLSKSFASDADKSRGITLHHMPPPVPRCGGLRSVVLGGPPLPSSNRPNKLPPQIPELGYSDHTATENRFYPASLRALGEGAGTDQVLKMRPPEERLAFSSLLFWRLSSVLDSLNL